jgi:2-amino-4-hydroxy-6-hydroxymethyldihydropteridine diphosphokinase
MRVFLGIGSNLGDRELNLRNAVSMMGELIGSVISASSVWETEPWGFTSESFFLNMVIEVETELKPSGVLGRILMTEAKMGRLRSGKGYASREIDIDILFYGSRIMNTRSLVIPHPKLHRRRFVLEPMNEIAPGFIHPVFGRDIRTLLKECTDKGRIERLHDHIPPLSAKL